MMHNKIVIVDLDGTLANCEHRQHQVRGEGKKRWDLFFKEMDKDSVNENLNDVILSLHQHYDIYFVSARPDNYRDKTVAWLYEKAGWHKDSYTLIMRKAGDFRKDNIVKKEILDNIIATGNYPIIAFDDRKQVVDMWRENNVLCAQVADHNF